MEKLTLLLNEVEKLMAKAYDHTKVELSRILANKAHPDILKNCSINYHGILSPLGQLAHISLQSSTVIVIKPWEKQLIPIIEKTLREDKTYNFNVRSDESIVYAALPLMTEETRQKLTKEVDKIQEKGRVSIRNLRKKYKDQIQDIKAEDIAQKGQENLQRLVDQYTNQIEEACKVKKERLMKV